VALLLLRGVLAVSVIAEGGFYIAGADSVTSAWFSGLLALAAGAMLLVGFLTPIAAAVVATGSIAVGLALLPTSTPTFFDSKSSMTFGITMLVAIAGLGPGAFSVDARVFGRREIIIPSQQD